MALALGEPCMHRGPTEFFVKGKSLEEAESPYGLHTPPPPPTPTAAPLQPSCDLVVTFPLTSNCPSPIPASQGLLLLLRPQSPTNAKVQSQ